ncbi:MAG: site-specific integrase [Rikenellaceae bacterium]
MASVKVKFRESTVREREGSIYYQIIHNRVVRQLITTYRIHSEEWNEVTSRIVATANDDPRRANFLQSLRSNIKFDTDRLNHIIYSLEIKESDYTSDDVVAVFQNQPKGETLFNFTPTLIERLKQLGKIRTAETYTATMKSFMMFREGADISLGAIDSNMMQCYEGFLKRRDAAPNTISFYMRVLRAIYNRAVEDGLIENKRPFRSVYTGLEKTLKRAIPLRDIKRIKDLDLTKKPTLELVRDMFIFSFYTRGMSFIDMAFLRKKDLSNSMITYRRSKTNQQLHIKWEVCMQQLLDKYDTKDTQYLLPIIRRSDVSERNQYRNALLVYNKRLKEIGEMVGLSVPLTLYVARHSWASVAKSKNVPIAVISEGMGHDSETTTQIYLASLDTKIVDKANNMILKLL